MKSKSINSGLGLIGFIVFIVFMYDLVGLV